ncbi:MAG: PTS glucose transporter subunit IIA [Thomasclavelia ramosa]
MESVLILNMLMTMYFQKSNGRRGCYCSDLVRGLCLRRSINDIISTGHAFGITRDDGVEILVHIGLDTVNLKGKGFTILKKKNQKLELVKNY